MADQYKILFLVNSKFEGLHGVRARGLTRYFKKGKVFIEYRKRRFFSVYHFIHSAFLCKPSIIYVVNISFDGTVAALFLKLFLKKPIIVDLGDINYYLLKESGRHIMVCLAAWVLENIALRQADIIVVRTNAIQNYLMQNGYSNIHCIPDGVECELFKPQQSGNIKNTIASKGELIVGVLGNIVWIQKKQWCYGIELIEALKILKNKPIKGLIVGEGGGLKILQDKAKKYGILGQIVFTGFVTHKKLPDYINAMDICLSTQTNDMVGRMKLAAKIPMYLACGKYILASDVGEARSILPKNMRLVYNGSTDKYYPLRLATALENIIKNRNLLNETTSLRKIAMERFDYKGLSERLEEIILNLK